MRALTLSAPAKINPYLEILGRRADGFHELETVFQTLELSDLVTVELNDHADVVVRSDDPALACDHSNLAWRAGDAVRQLRPASGFAITLKKRIPMAAGLGGGSSDAAAVLRAAQLLLTNPLSAGDIATIAAALGSDVPFFLFGGTAHALGRGERLTPLPDLPPLPVTVCKPVASLSTPLVYGALSSEERGPRQALGPAECRQKLAADPPSLHNRLTGPARRLEPSVASLLDWLAAQDAPSLLSGSGSACFIMSHIEPPPGIAYWHTQFRPRARLDAVGE
jgi:4-diphosphocytidyl-2-C-methyl-D-erythritol kinase